MTDKKIPASSPRRRLLLQGSSAFAAGLAVPAFVRAQGSSPIRIGHLTLRTGFLGPMGEYAVLGATMADEEVNAAGGVRTEEHTSELQSLMRISYAVFCLIKKKDVQLRSLVHLMHLNI